MRVLAGAGCVLLSSVLVGCADEEPAVDEYGWPEETFDELVEREMEIRETTDWYDAPLDVQPERFIEPGEAEEVRGACVLEAGWEGIVDHVDILEVPADQREDAEQAYWECVARFPSDPRMLGNFSADEMPEEYLRALYEDEQSIRECLVDEGIRLPEGPSFEVYEEVQRSGDPSRLPEARHPHIEVQRLHGIEVFEEMQEVCPRSDGSEYLPDIPPAPSH